MDHRRWTPENIEYETEFCTWVFNTFVITNQQYRLRFLGETGRERHNIIAMTSCAPGRHRLPLEYLVFEGSLDGHFFSEIVVRWIAFGCFAPGDVLVMNNSSVHLSGDVLEPLGHVLAEHGVQLVRLPSYSPNLNPIKLIWNTIKARLPPSKECAPAAFLPLLITVLNTVTFNDIQNAMMHQSYFR
jgi:hypothetical protein